MARYVTLSRAARLVGVSRGVLQKRIRAGDLSTFEGMVDVTELLRAYPDTAMEDDSMLDRMEHIMESAVAKVVRNPQALPDAETLAARVSALSGELSKAGALMGGYLALLEQTRDRLADVRGRADGEVREDLDALIGWLDDAVKTPPGMAVESERMFARDTYLRIMAATVELLPSRHDFFVEGTDTLLESALNAGHAVAYGCNDGSCGRCRARVVTGTVKKVREHPYEIPEAEADAGVVLMCANTAVTDLRMEAPEASGPGDLPLETLSARVDEVQAFGGDLLRVRVKTPPSHRLRFLAGQGARLRAGARGRDLGEQPIASCPCDERYLEFHLRGQAEALRPGTAVELQGPTGAFTLDDDDGRPLCLVAWERGFAPLKALAEHAMSLDHAESIQLHWLAADSAGHYLHNRCRSWADALDDFEYHPAIVSPPAEPAAADVDAWAAALAPALGALGAPAAGAGARVFVAGPGGFIAAVGRALEDAGVPAADVASTRVD